MRTNSFLVGALASVIALATISGCKKKEEEPATVAPAPEPAAAPPPAATDASANTNAAAPGGDDLGDIKRYPGETPLSGTVRVKVPFNAYQEADLNSEKLGGIPAGTFIDLVATHSNWMLVKYPVGVGELGPGWINLANIYDTRVTKEDPPPDRPKLKVKKVVRKKTTTDDKKADEKASDRAAEKTLDKKKDEKKDDEKKVLKR